MRWAKDESQWPGLVTPRHQSRGYMSHHHKATRGNETVLCPASLCLIKIDRKISLRITMNDLIEGNKYYKQYNQIYIGVRYTTYFSYLPCVPGSGQAGVCLWQNLFFAGPGWRQAECSPGSLWLVLVSLLSVSVSHTQPSSYRTLSHQTQALSWCQWMN